MAPGEPSSHKGPGRKGRLRCTGLAQVLCLLLAPTLLAAAAAVAADVAVSSAGEGPGAAQGTPRAAGGAVTGGRAPPVAAASGTSKGPAEAPCGGVLLAYRVLALRPVPFPGASAFQFNASLALTNMGSVALRAPWQLRLSFTHSEVITGVQGADLAPGAALPLAGDGALLANPQSLLLLQTALQAAGNPALFQHNISLQGTELGAATLAVALPSGVALLASGFQCGKSHQVHGQGKLRGNSHLESCCTFNPALPSNPAGPPAPPLALPGPALASITGGPVTLEWDVISASARTYQVLVRITNNQPYANISSDPGWALSWTWQMGEIILSCDGCQTLLSQDCLEECDACTVDPQLSVLYPPPYSCDTKPLVFDGTSLNGSLAAAAYGPPYFSTNFTLTMARARPFWGASSSAGNSSNETTASSSAPPPPQLLLPLSFDFSAGDPSQALDTFARAGGTPGSSTGAPMGPTSAPAVSFSCPAPQRLPTGVVLQLRSPQGAESNVRSLESFVLECVPPSSPHPVCCVSASAFFNDTLAPCLSCTCRCPSALAPLDLTVQGGGTCSASSAAATDSAAALLLGADLAGLEPPKGLALSNDSTAKPRACDTGCPLQVHLTIAEADSRGWVLKGAVRNAGKDILKEWSMAVYLPHGIAKGMTAVAGAVLQEVSNPSEGSLLLHGVVGTNNWILGEGGNVLWAMRFNASSEAQSDNATGLHSALAPSPAVDPLPTRGASANNIASAYLESGLLAFPTKIMVQGVECKMPPFMPTTVSKGGQRMRHLWRVQVKALDIAFMNLGYQAQGLPVCFLFLLGVTIILKGIIID